MLRSLLCAVTVTIVILTVLVQCAFGLINLTVSTDVNWLDVAYIDDCCTTPEYAVAIDCSKDSVHLPYGYCITWNNATSQLEIGRCMFLHQHNGNIICSKSYDRGSYTIPRNLSVFKVNEYTCRPYNRQDAKCGQCIEGYGPAVFLMQSPVLNADLLITFG